MDVKEGVSGVLAVRGSPLFLPPIVTHGSYATSCPVVEVGVGSEARGIEQNTEPHWA